MSQQPSEIERLRADVQRLKDAEAAERCKRIMLAKEVRYLRYYGNKDCTQMADKAMQLGVLED